MKIGRITGTPTFDERRIFNGMDITAEYLDQKERVRSLSFHYAYATNNLQGWVEKVLNSVLENKEAPQDVTNIQTNWMNV
jgi:hypothetical protein